MACWGGGGRADTPQAPKLKHSKSLPCYLAHGNEDPLDGRAVLEAWERGGLAFSFSGDCRVSVLSTCAASMRARGRATSNPSLSSSFAGGGFSIPYFASACEVLVELGILKQGKQACLTGEGVKLLARTHTS